QKSHVDELPQLINVLLGSMSLVGPRPHTPEHVMLYEDWQKERLLVKPGITCLRQLREPYKKISFNSYIEDDIKYINQWSFWLDLYILMKTALTFTKMLTKKQS
ncbi:MAG: sugar transferase, partial [Bacteroidales bacterium]